MPSRKGKKPKGNHAKALAWQAQHGAGAEAVAPAVAHQQSSRRARKEHTRKGKKKIHKQKKMRTVLGGVDKAADRLAGTIRSNGTLRLTAKDRDQKMQVVRGAVITYLQKNFHDGTGRQGEFRSYSRSFLDSQLSRLRCCKFPVDKSITVLGERYAQRLRDHPVNMVLHRRPTLLL